MTKQTIVVRQHVVRTGWGLGSIAAVVCSWIVNKSVVWACLHLLLGWLYVFYAACAYAEQLDQAARAALG